MTDLKITTVVTNYVDYYDLQTYFGEKIGKEFEIIGASNDTDHTVNVKPFNENDPMAKWDMEDINKVLASGIIDLERSSFRPFMSWACKQGWIPEGKYCVRVSW